MGKGAGKIGVSLVLVLIVSCGLSFASLANAQSYYYPLSQNWLNVQVNYPGAGYVYPGSGYFYYGSTVYAYVYTNPGYVFNGWYLNGVYQGKLTSIPITMTQDYTLVATFSVRTVCLTITNNPYGGGQTAPTAGIWNYSIGSTVTVTAYPNAGCNFSGWYLDGVYQGLGTSISVPMTQDRQIGAFYSGNIPDVTPSPSPQATPNPTPPNSNLPVPSLSFYCASSTTSSGFKVNIDGALVYNQIGLSGSGILFAYSANGGQTWHDLAYLITGDGGNFSAVWMPSASGNYLIKGTWLGDDAYAPLTTAISFAVTPSNNEDDNVFSVSSNSTLSALNFDSEADQLGFTVSGPSGTVGYVQICIPQSVMPVVANLKIYLDGQEVPYHTYAENNAWIITTEYTHSTHSVVMALDGSSAPLIGDVSESMLVPILVGVVVVSLLVAIVSVVLMSRQRKQIKNQDAPQ
ncbi:MAG: InlB B-repeat-containing protein [Candidatus Bathyarchaeota archaeon]|nr:InlB B-repeat-containing protein [Candidatus Bathyarchaeota archaeon]